MNPILESYNKVNAFGQLIGLELSVVRPGKVMYTMLVTDRHMSNPLAAHGGVVAALMDGILGVSALSLSVEEKKLVSTVEFKINYYAPIKNGDLLTGIGEVVFSGNRLISSEGSIFCKNQNNKLVCKGLGTFNTYPADKNELFQKASSE